MEKIKSQFEQLVSEGESLINTKRGGPKKAKKWSNEVQVWLNKNLPESGLTNDVILVLPSFEPTNSGRGLKSIDHKGVKKIYGILLKAKNLIPILATGDTYKPSPEGYKKVFIVHGHDEALKSNVARLVEKVGLEAVILHEQSNRGRTIIEKFSDHSNVSFALVLLTGDDYGRAKAAPVSEEKSRARQNVIFELGYFFGKLGRKRVSVIYQEGVELPSDYHGVLFIPHDNIGNWEVSVAKELRDAGLPVDLNKI